VKGQVLILPSKKEGHIRRGGVIRKGNSTEDLQFQDNKNESAIKKQQPYPGVLLGHRRV